MNSRLTDYQHVRGLAIQSLFEIIEQSSEGTVIVDRDANIVWMNERYAKRFGLKSAEEAIGQACEQVISNSLLRQVVRTDRPILLDIQDTPKGPLVVMRLPIHDDAGEVIGAIGFALFDELRNLSPLIERYLSMQQELASTRLAAARTPEQIQFRALYRHQRRQPRSQAPRPAQRERRVAGAAAGGNRHR